MAPQSKNDGLEQVATRVSEKSARVLKLAAAAEDKSMTEFLRPAVERYAEELAAEPEIAEMLKQARKFTARKQGVELLPEGRQAKTRRSSRRSPTNG
jgi:uncharacterized protein (DUF1778 family)